MTLEQAARELAAASYQVALQHDIGRHGMLLNLAIVRLERALAAYRAAEKQESSDARSDG